MTDEARTKNGLLRMPLLEELAVTSAFLTVEIPPQAAGLRLREGGLMGSNKGSESLKIFFE